MLGMNSWLIEATGLFDLVYFKAIGVLGIHIDLILPLNHRCFTRF